MFVKTELKCEELYIDQLFLFNFYIIKNTLKITFCYLKKLIIVNNHTVLLKK